MGAAEVEAFLTHLAVLAALLFLYREVLNLELPWLTEVTRARKPPRLPVVLTTEEEVRKLLAQLDGVYVILGGLCAGWSFG